MDRKHTKINSVGMRGFYCLYTFSVIKRKPGTFVVVDVCKASQAGLLDEVIMAASQRSPSCIPGGSILALGTRHTSM